MKRSLSAVVVTAVGAAVIAPAYDASPSAISVARVASFVAGKHVSVYCVGMHGSEGGLAIVGSSAITVSSANCLAARHALTRPSLRGGEALLVVAHEAEHARGFADETDAECNAMRVFPTVLASLRASAPARRLLAAGAVAADRALPSSYHAHPCSQASRTPSPP